MKDRLNKRESSFRRNATWVVLFALIPSGFAEAQSSGGGYILRKSVIGAGVSAQGSPYRIEGTAAQLGAGVASGGGYRLTGGFHQPRQSSETDRIFCNGFENTACTSTSGAPQ